MKIEEYAYNRLEKLGTLLKEELDIILGLKLSGSSADGHFFLLQFGDLYVSSDYDVIVLLSRYPYKEEVSKIKKILKTPVYKNVIEKILIENIDIKLVTVEYPYQGKGVKVASIYDQDINLIRHLIGGKIVYGKEHFDKIKLEGYWIRRQLAHRVLERKKIFDIFTDLGAYDRIATILNMDKIKNKIKEVISKYKNYHKMTVKEINELSEKASEIKKEVINKLNE